MIYSLSYSVKGCVDFHHAPYVHQIYPGINLGFCVLCPKCIIFSDVTFDIVDVVIMMR